MTNTGFEAFDRTVQKSIHWLDSIAGTMGREDRQHAYQAMKSVLHALRDRLTVEEAVHLGAQIPMLLRGMYFEGWNPSQVPMKIRERQEFIDHVGEGLGPLLSEIPPQEAITAVLTVLQHRITEGEIEDVQRMMPEELLDLWPESLVI